ncbi:hypothetical protein ACVOMT_13670 [Sphingomonas panni]
MTILASLIASLGLESTSFHSGIDNARKKMKSAEREFNKIGDNLTKAGAGLSAIVTAPIVGMGAAFIGAAKDMAAGLPELERAAQLANVGTTRFQKLAFAAKSIGIEQEKLGDIYKDTNDKVGDFLATGGGEMKDFFTTIAPKVGLTAESFRKLSGPDALQAYYNALEKAKVSQPEMVFYMESIADEASALIPLLRENGRAFTELGGKAAILSPSDIENLKAYNAASRDWDTALRSITISLVRSGLLQGVTELVKDVADLAAGVSEVNPELMKWGIGMASVAAAAGPALMGIGSLVKFMAPFAAGTAPVIGTAGAGAVGLGGTGLLGIASVLGPMALLAGGVVVAYQHWDKIGPWIDQVAARMDAWATKTDAQLAAFNADVEAMDRQLGIPSKDVFLASVEKNFGESIARIDDWLAGIQRWAADYDAAVERMEKNTIASMQRMYTGVKTWVHDKLNAIWDSVMEKVRAVDAGFFKLYDAVVGHSYVPDMVDEIGVQMARLDKNMVGVAGKATGATADAFRALEQEVSPILDRLFPDEAAERDYRKDSAAIDAWAKKAGLSDAALADAQQRLRKEHLGIKSPDEVLDGIFTEQGAFDLPTPELKPFENEVDKVFGKVKGLNADLVKSFATTTRDVAGSLQGLVGNIKSGDWLSALSGVADLVVQISGLIGGGGGGATAVFNRGFGGFRADGGSVMPRTGYVVGERGPELFVPRTSGMVVPNHALGQRGAVVQLVVGEGQIFEPRVQSISGNVSVQTVRGNNTRAAMSQRQSLVAA